MRISGVIVIDHTTNLSRIIPKIAKSARMVVGLLVLLVHLVSQPCGEKGEKLADVFRVGVHECERGECAKLSQNANTANPAAGKAMRLRLDCSLVMEYENLSSWLCLLAHSSNLPRTSSILLSLRGSVLILPAP